MDIYDKTFVVEKLLEFLGKRTTKNKSTNLSLEFENW